MDPFSKTHYAESPTIFGSHFYSHTNFPIIGIAIIGILATAFLLISYYVFVIKCCLNWHRIDLLRRFSLSRNSRTRQDSIIAAESSPTENRGLDENVISSIPVFRFDKVGKIESECAVCLNEFQEEENLKKIPNCGHVFHIDCIDVWLQSNSNCPLCRAIISILSTQINSSEIVDDSSSNDQDFVVIELGHDQNMNQSYNTEEFYSSPSSRTLEQSIVKKKGKRSGYVSRGDECIDIRVKCDQFSVQTVRRSFSLNSADERKNYLGLDVEQSSETSSTVRISYFPFGCGRGSRNSVRPIHLES